MGFALPDAYVMLQIWISDTLMLSCNAKRRVFSDHVCILPGWALWIAPWVVSSVTKTIREGKGKFQAFQARFLSGDVVSQDIPP